MWVNFAWLLTIVVLPFTTQVTAVYGAQSRLAVALYLGSVAVSSLCLAGLALMVRRRPSLRRPGVSADEAAPAGWYATSLLLLVAFALGVAVPPVNYWAALLLLLSSPLEALLARRRSTPAP